MVNSADFTKRLEKILDFYGLSATAFSEKITFNRSTISHLLSGRNKPSLEFVMKVVQTFKEVDLYWLLNGKGSFPSTPEKVVFASEEKNNYPEIETPSPSEKNLSQQLIDPKPTIPHRTASDSKTVDRIVIFYTDGSFKDYLP